MFTNVHMIGVGSYHPKKVVENKHFIEHFKEFNLHHKAEMLMNKLGRKKLTLAKHNENGITMSVSAGKDALKKANLSVEDIDMIISASDTPEYLTPCCALIIRNKLGAKNAKTVFDVNCDCIGMLHAIDIASKYLKTDKNYKRVLVVGSLLISPFAREDDIIVYSTIGDGAAAMILEAREEEEERGFLGSRAFTDDSYNETIRFPACGLSNIPNENINGYERKMCWKPFSVDFLSKNWTKLITNLLKEHALKPEDVEHYFMSQFSKEEVITTMNNLNVKHDRAIFVGDKYGYTGPTSPVMALDDKLKESSFKKGDLCVFCSVAGGYSMSALLYRW
ncbi:ketoacyl-ACP synthase III [Clostridium botulinum]|uniref:3-oxoacyl-ACP synthase n=1 Tax=Clostridium botulinum C/D str. DC5 TaxID=1443128 RepID=A0A0A0IDK3_CLOBO|nr:ketoacyl-ACP synthase III [Clostridium botulinum]KEI01009.1 3-oxoacyl-ACP synthase [Clostridium botulinum C/D str. BKT75002]KEI11175.1 3-oxoacyl-ACP synthase [Clostridium botulinum C/D str. BKT2873]KGM94013.1 3-oxoacyl-ACP synthase [Clostridium botulinum D str. CCUG 7971]KGM99037.1 3-oxoacyl-ACP synthase [Clostridium botulinum C/D str. DC5]KOC47366.1 3-oxoacyl-ACP synthase [Clostridium botulinum]